MAIALTEVPRRSSKRATQLRNEQRMVRTTIDLLANRSVDEVTSRVIADASGTNVSYIIRYFGSRDAMLAVVADELCASIVELILEHGGQVGDDEVLSFFAAVSSEPEVAIWIKLNRHLTSYYAASAQRPGGTIQVMRAVEAVMASVLGVSSANARPMAVLAMTLLVGNDILAPALGTTDQEFAMALELATAAVVRRAELLHMDEDACEEAS